MTKIIGITGPTGAGKTTALHALQELGGELIDADAVYHQLLAQSQPLQQSLVDAFGDIFDTLGHIDRKKLGGIVFADPAALERLNEITHHFVDEEVERRIAQAQRTGKVAVAIDAIRLIESGMGERCDAIVAIVAPEELRVRRIMAREGISEDYARQRVGAQQKADFFCTHSTHVLENQEQDTPEAFEQRARELFRTMI